tara:strand:+ start:283 stop:594 length:312 start_codon:yes stop_codon:yes gene_type:complete
MGYKQPSSGLPFKEIGSLPAKQMPKMGAKKLDVSSSVPENVMNVSQPAEKSKKDLVIKKGSESKPVKKDITRKDVKVARKNARKRKTQKRREGKIARYDSKHN